MSDLDRACITSTSFHARPNMGADDIVVRAKMGELSAGEAPSYVTFGVRMPGAEFTVYLTLEQFGYLTQKIQNASMELDAELHDADARIDLDAEVPRLAGES